MKRQQAAGRSLFRHLRCEGLLLSAYAGLSTVSLLVPSDVPAGLGQFVIPGMLWMLLGVAATTYWTLRAEKPETDIHPQAAPNPNPLHVDSIDCLSFAYLTWQLIATIALRHVGDMRSGVNAFFQTASFVVAVVVGRRLVRTAEQRRDFLTMALSLATSVALLGIFQHVQLNPQRHQQWREHPEELLQPFGIEDVESPEARRTLDRALSPEPLGSFALTNSLAAYLVPSILLLAGAFWNALQQTIQKKERGSLAPLLILGIALLLCMTCLVFTKSRASFLALVVGLAFLGMVNLRVGQNLWKWAAGICVVIVGLLLVTISVAGVMDRALISDAPASVLYRLQYWQSSAALIADHPVFGSGPGNFKNLYVQYKLPEASEEIGDPHNFVFEVAATAGIPALLLFVLLLVASFKASRQHQQSQEPEPSNGHWMLAGAAIGVGAMALLPGLGDGAWLWMFFLPVALIVWRWGRPALRPTFNDSRCIHIAVGALLLNLLAAGGIGFPNVSSVLAGLLVLLAPYQHVRRPNSRVLATCWLLGSVAFCIGCFLMCYRPVLQARSDTARGAYAEAEAADRWDPQLSLAAAGVALSEFQQTKSPESWERAHNGFHEAIRRDPRSYGAYNAAGEAHLIAFRILNDQALANQAVDAFGKAVQCYPNFSMLHAHLAWAAHVAGQTELAREHAREALRLDDLCPHADKKLAGYRVTDPGMDTELAELPLAGLMRRLAE